MVSTEECLFCKLVRKEIPPKTVYEDSETLAFLDINPASHGHTLVIPKKHVANIYGITDSALGDVMKTVKMLSEKIKNKLGANGVNILLNNERHAGQIIDHIHVHIIPRYEGDGISIQFPRAQISEEESKKIQDKLRSEEKKPSVSMGFSPF